MYRYKIHIYKVHYVYVYIIVCSKLHIQSYTHVHISSHIMVWLPTLWLVICVRLPMKSVRSLRLTLECCNLKANPIAQHLGSVDGFFFGVFFGGSLKVKCFCMLEELLGGECTTSLSTACSGNMLLTCSKTQVD